MATAEWTFHCFNSKCGFYFGKRSFIIYYYGVPIYQSISVKTNKPWHRSFGLLFICLVWCGLILVRRILKLHQNFRWWTICISSSSGRRNHTATILLNIWIAKGNKMNWMDGLMKVDGNERWKIKCLFLHYAFIKPLERRPKRLKINIC